jgi:hypothetical protein
LAVTNTLCPFAYPSQHKPNSSSNHQPSPPPPKPPTPPPHLSLCAPNHHRRAAAASTQRHASPTPATTTRCVQLPSVAPTRDAWRLRSAAAAACAGQGQDMCVRDDAHRPSFSVYKSFTSSNEGRVVSASTYVCFHTLFRVLFVPCHFVSFFLFTSPVSLYLQLLHSYLTFHLQ